ncbi:MAG: LamG domain-containing protein [Lentisphaerae bacterium]|nr:LamG domain-containing protein [Lentisphaerota bacterium]
MKMYAFAAVFAAAAMLTAADEVINFSMQEAAPDKITNSGSVQLPLQLRNPEKLSVKPGRAGKNALFFDNPVNSSSDRGKHGAIWINNKQGQINFAQPFSITAWIWMAPDMKRQAYYSIVTDTQGVKGPGFRFFYAYERLEFRLGNGKEFAAAVVDSAKHPMPRGVWHHVAAVFDGKSANIYINGALAASKEIGSMQPAAASNALTIGSYRFGYDEGWRGAIYDLKIFARALPPAAILSMVQTDDE